MCATGQTTGFNAEARDRDLPFTSKDEPATLPRVSELIIITEYTPWCTIVRNPAGVTMNDICTTIWKECVSYSILLSDPILTPCEGTRITWLLTKNLSPYHQECKTRFGVMLQPVRAMACISTSALHSCPRGSGEWVSQKLSVTLHDWDDDMRCLHRLATGQGLLREAHSQGCLRKGSPRFLCSQHICNALERINYPISLLVYLIYIFLKLNCSALLCTLVLYF